MKKSFQIRVGRRGTIALPTQLGYENNINEGDLLTLLDLGDGIVVMNCHRSRVDEILNKLAREWQDSGESLESTLTTLHRLRANDAKKP